MKKKRKNSVSIKPTDLDCFKNEIEQEQTNMEMIVNKRNIYAFQQLCY